LDLDPIEKDDLLVLGARADLQQFIKDYDLTHDIKQE
jgi:hypothetical protein